jgi:chlorobactene glucosyltransferase
MSAVWHLHYQMIIFFLVILQIIAILNIFGMRRFDQYPQSVELPYVSILIPARNEQENIETCIRSILAQDYPQFEVIVLDDYSTDNTLFLLRKMAKEDSRLRVMSGLPMPADWFGKHWACHQLYQKAVGQLLLFTDADTYHSPSTLRDSVASLVAENADLVSAFPQQKVVTWGEKLIVPVISWGIFSILPIPLAHRLQIPGISITIGQFMLFKRQAFEAIGGYEAIKLELVDDVALGRNIILNGLQWRFLDGTHHIQCRMYQGFLDVIDGFTKNIFAIFDYRVLPYLVVWIWVGIVFLEPLLSVLFRWMGMGWLTNFPPNLALIAILQSLVLWLSIYKRFRFAVYLSLLYPLSISIFIFTALRSMFYTITGQVTWKERKLAKEPIRWIW